MDHRGKAGWWSWWITVVLLTGLVLLVPGVLAPGTFRIVEKESAGGAGQVLSAQSLTGFKEVPTSPHFRVYIPLLTSPVGLTGTLIAREGDTVRLGLPKGVAVEFLFEADQVKLPLRARSSWFIDGRPAGDSLGSRLFAAGQHRVELEIIRPSDTAMSTPATAFPPERAGVTLELVEHAQHVCPGRLGGSCTGLMSGVINPLTRVNHYQVFGRVRVAAEVSAGSIKHDSCCSKQARWGVALMCPTTAPLTYLPAPSPTRRPCGGEWAEAIGDTLRELTWLGEWVYEGDRFVSSRTLAPPGAWLQDQPGNEQYCESGRVERGGRAGLVRCSGQVSVPPWVEESRAYSPDRLHLAEWTKADGLVVTDTQTGRTTRVPFERFRRAMLTPYVEREWWFSYWDGRFKWAENGRQFAFTRCSVDWDKPPCAVFVHDLKTGSAPEMVAGELVTPAYNGPAPLGFAGDKLMFRGWGEVYEIYEYDLAGRLYRSVVSGAVGGSELSPNRDLIAYFTGDDLLIFNLSTRSTSIVVRRLSNLPNMVGGDPRSWTVSWRSPTRLMFGDLNRGEQAYQEVDVSGVKMGQPR